MMIIDYADSVKHLSQLFYASYAFFLHTLGNVYQEVNSTPVDVLTWGEHYLIL